MNDDFYIGYSPKAADPTRGVMRRTVAALVLLAVLAGVLLAARQHYDPARFEFGDVREYEGTLTAQPAPILFADDGYAYLIVAAGKHGLAESAEPRRVRIWGTLIERGDTRMLEMDGPVNSLSGQPAAPPVDGPPRPIRLTGEITGSKCYLGVMNPGRGPTHRACAKLCIRGGVPPMLHAHTESGDELHVLLAGVDVAERVLPFVALPVAVTGGLWRTGSLWVLNVEDVQSLSERQP